MLKEQLRSDRYILKYDISFIHVTFGVNLAKDTLSRSDISITCVIMIIDKTSETHEGRMNIRDGDEEEGWRKIYLPRLAA